MTALLEVRDVESGYGRLQILRGVSLAVGDNEVVSILGANGAGKTTLLRAISGLLPLWSGAITLGGKPIGRRTPEARARLGLGHLPEGRGILGTLTVRDNLRLGMLGVGVRSRSDQSERFDETLEQFPLLKKRLQSRASELSGGQQGILAVARALVARPRLLLIDELSFGLAPMIVEQLFEVLSGSRPNGMSVVLVEQNSDVLNVSDRTYILRNGTCIFEGNSRDVDPDTLVDSYLGNRSSDPPAHHERHSQ
ncbi:MAG: ABC transporter ATP-binding protein [Acidimicrobiales bacterium]